FLPNLRRLSIFSSQRVLTRSFFPGSLLYHLFDLSREGLMSYPACSSALAIWALFGVAGTAPAQGADTLAPWLEKARPEIERILGYPSPAIRVEVGKREDPQNGDVEAHLRLKFPHLDKTTYPQALADALAVNEQAELARNVRGTIR